MSVPFAAPYNFDAPDSVMLAPGLFVPLDEALRRRADDRKRKPGAKQSHLDLYDYLGWPIVRTGDLVGCSDGTDSKCEQALWLFRRQVSICGRMAAKYGQRCMLLDTNCGPGGFVWEAEFGNRYSRIPIRGTPLQFLRALAKDPSLPNWDVGFIDIQKRHCDELNQRLSDWQHSTRAPLPRTLDVIDGDNEIFAPDWVQQHFSGGERPFGFVVHDANAGIDPVLVHRLGQLPQLERVDFLLYVPAAKFKWHKQDLVELLEPCGKTVWLLGPVRGHWQHLWMVGTRWKSCPDYARINFVRWDSPAGEERWSLITRTRTERAA